MKIWIIRIIGILLMVGGPMLMSRFDETDPDQRYLKMLCLFAIPVGVFLLFATVLNIGV